MNRRKAIRNLLLVTGVAVVGTGGYEWYSTNKRPSLADMTQYKALIDEMAETIIPRTDTPGAKDAGVGDTIRKLVAECVDVRAQNKFIYGLHDVEEYCHSKFGRSFVDCMVEQRQETLLHFEQKGKRHAGILGKIEHKFLGDPFFETLKKYTVISYATSQLGATQGFAYDFIPGTYEAAVPLKPGQRSWAIK